jgi:hypothetical protein
MPDDFAEQKFNDDLLLGKKDRELAERRYPTILHILDNPSLRRYFEKFDAPANRAKRSSRRAGFLAIVLAGVALMVASGEDLLRQFLEWLLRLPPDYEFLPHVSMRTLLVVLSAAAGIGSVIIGSVGVLCWKEA